MARSSLPLYSHQGHVIRHIKVSEWNALASDPAFEIIEGRLTKISYQKSREETPSALTCADIKLIAGEFGDPRPEETRRDGYVDPIEAAREKLQAWNLIPSASQQAQHEISKIEFEHIDTMMDAVVVDGDIKVIEHQKYSNFA